jgi:DNA-binding NtrC family response regulator
MGENTMMIQQEVNETQSFASTVARVPDGARILIACEDQSTTERLKNIFREAGLISESTRSMTEACRSAKSGRFQVVVSTPTLSDGSWERLIGIAHHFDLGFEVVLWARNFDLMEWSEALKEGAFDVLDATRELPKAAEVIKRALWAAYLKGAGPHPELASHRAAA